MKRLFRSSNEAGGAAASGRWGEQAAAEFLQRSCGFRIVARNWRDGREEIDLVCTDGDVLVFVEVKTRRSGSLVPGYYSAVTPRKRKALGRVIHAYLRSLRHKPLTFRYDVVEVARTPGGKPEVLHFANIPLFSKSYRWR